MDVTFKYEFEKANAEGSYVRGWASVVLKDSALVRDWDGDVIPIEEIRKTAHKFIVGERSGKVEHKGQVVGEVVESLIIDDDVAKSLGIADKRRGWFIGMRVYDPAIQEGVRAGKFTGFSIAGRGDRVKVAA